MPITSIQRDTNNNVSLVRMISSDSLSVIDGTNYILTQMPIINELNGGTWQWFITDMILCAADDGNGFFEFVDDTFTTLVMFGEKGHGIIMPGLQNQLPYYSINGSTLAPLASLNNAVLGTSNSGVPALTVTLPSVVQLNITKVGIVGTGTWNATAVTIPYGGTGNTTFTAYSVICAGTTATGAFQNVSGLGTSGYILTSNGAGTLPSWQISPGSGTVNPGTQNDLAYYPTTGSAVSAIATADYGVLITSGLGVPSWLANGTTGQVLTSTASGIPSWQNISFDGAITTIDADSGSATPTSGTVTLSGGSTGLTTSGSSSTVSLAGLLNATYGGTGVSAPTAHGIMVAEGSSAMTSLVLSSGQIPIGSTGVDPVAAAINSGTSILVANGAGSITVGLAAIASHDILSNITSGSAAPIANTLTATIDAAIGSTQGNILYRGSSVWSVLAPGTATQVLQTGGASANPSWVTAVVSGGGTGNTTFTAYSIICAGTTATGPFQNVSGVGSANQVLVSNGASALPTWQSVPGLTPAALTQANDTNVTLTLGGTPATALLQATSITAGWSGQLSVGRGGTGVATLTAHYLLIGAGSSAVTLLAPSATSGVPLISQGASADPAYGTAVVAGGGTGAATFTAYSVICAGTTATGAFQNVSGVGTSGQILTSNGASALPTWQTITGTGTVNSGSQNQLAWYAANGTAVSGLSTANSGVLVTSSGGVPSISSTLPAHTTSSITFNPTTSGLVGTTTNDNASTGYVGEFVSSQIVNASAVSLATGTNKDVTSISLTAGDWDVMGNVYFNPGGTISYIAGWTNNASATTPDNSLYALDQVSLTGQQGFVVPYRRYSLSTTTVIYLTVVSGFSVSNTVSGGIYARRAR